jgi:hypothetical protein
VIEWIAFKALRKNRFATSVSRLAVSKIQECFRLNRWLYTDTSTYLSLLYKFRPPAISHYPSSVKLGKTSNFRGLERSKFVEFSESGIIGISWAQVGWHRFSSVHTSVPIDESSILVR